MLSPELSAVRSNSTLFSEYRLFLDLEWRQFFFVVRSPSGLIVERLKPPFLRVLRLQQFHGLTLCRD